MNKLLLSFAWIVMVCLVACDTTPNVEGTWIGAPVRIDSASSADVLGPVADCQVASTFNFVASDKSNGTVNITSDITMLDAVDAPVDSPIATYEISVSATASISGTYTFTDDDDMVLTLDYSTLTVHLDPEAITYNQNLLDNTQAPAIDSLRPILADRYRKAITSQIRADYAKYQHMEDVKINNSILTCEVDDRDMSFRKAD